MPRRHEVGTDHHNHGVVAAGQTHNRSGMAGTPQSRARTRFENLLLRAQITRRELREVTKVHANTVCNWSRGGPLPGAVVAYLELRAKVITLLSTEKPEHSDK